MRPGVRIGYSGQASQLKRPGSTGPKKISYTDQKRHGEKLDADAKYSFVVVDRYIRGPLATAKP